MPRTKSGPRKSRRTSQIPPPATRFPGQLRSEQFRDHLIRQIETMEPGTKLPSERTLAKESGLSLLTVNKVLATIAAEGYLERRPGSGTYVLERTRRNGSEKQAQGLQVLRFVVKNPSTTVLDGTVGYTSHFYQGLREAARKDGIEVLPTAFELTTDGLQRLPQDAFHSANVVGAIFVEDGVPDYRPLWQYLKEGRRMVAFDFAAPETGLSTVMYGDTEGVQAAVEHCAAYGHRRIAYIGPSGNVGQPNELRMAGFRAGVAKAGLDPAACPIHLVRFDESRPLGREILSKPASERPTAFVGFMDYYLLDLIKAGWDLNLKCPEDFSVCGFGDALNLDPLAPVKINSYLFDEIQMGQTAYDLWKTGAKGIVKRQSGKLMVRGSVAPPKA